MEESNTGISFIQGRLDNKEIHYTGNRNLVEFHESFMDIETANEFFNNGRSQMSNGDKQTPCVKITFPIPPGVNKDKMIDALISNGFKVNDLCETDRSGSWFELWIPFGMFHGQAEMDFMENHVGKFLE